MTALSIWFVARLRTLTGAGHFCVQAPANEPVPCHSQGAYALLSYLHAYHAGNEADLHKHLALMGVLHYLKRKPAPFAYVDCHAGRGYYDLESTQARTTSEAKRGVLRLVEHWQITSDRHQQAPGAAMVQAYLKLLNAWSAFDFPRYYPGSPIIAQQLMRENDTAQLMELHPQEYRTLRRYFASDRRVSVHNRDSFEGLGALIPPRNRRGAVLLDPSYELKTDFSKIAASLKAASKLWPQGIYIVWYPILSAERHLEFITRLSRLPQERKFRSEIRWQSGAADRRGDANGPGLARSKGLLGSGIIILNTPWQFEDEFEKSAALIASLLGEGDSAQHECELL